MGGITEGGSPTLVPDMVRALGYAQVRSWASGLLGGPAPNPEAMVCLALRRLEASHRLDAWDDVVAAVLRELRETTARTIVDRVRGSATVISPRVPLIYGDGAWIEAVIDRGARAHALSVEAPGVLDAAIRLVDFAKPRIDRARARRTADTQPIGVPAHPWDPGASDE